MRKILSKRNIYIFILLLIIIAVFFYCTKIIFQQRLENKENYQILSQNKLADFVKTANNQVINSNFTMIFNQKNMPKSLVQTTFLFAGDMMLGRGVEILMDKNGIYYPFEQISRIFKGVDIAVANLEGPIIKNPPYTAPNSLQFAFKPEVIEALKFSQINLVSLANNHTLNMGQDGLKQTKEFLDQVKIDYVGDPLKCSKEFAYIKDNFIILAFNKTYAQCKVADIVNTIKEVRQENKDKFLIITIHWGKEYKTTNTEFQQKVGHQIIEAGADLIIGHHPHVVENIEEYNGKLIFYSLGNFVFDQYFSKNTQEGLAVGLEINADKLLFKLLPMHLNFSQPFLMNKENKREFLEKLAKKSSEKLQGQIKNGVIEVKR